MRPFYELTRPGRARRLRELAVRALESYPLEVCRVRTITIETNGIFRVDTVDGEKYVLRVSDPWNCHGIEEIRSEMAWLHALAGETDLAVPAPISSLTGGFVVTAEAPCVPEPRHCQVFSWLPGPDLGERLTPENMRLLGCYIAGLHLHAGSWAPPEGFRVRRLDRVFYYAEAGFDTVEPILLLKAGREGLTGERTMLFREAADRANGALKKLFAGAEEPRVIHNDLHVWNLKVSRGRIGALDFEDLAMGYPVQDLSITLFHLPDDGERDGLVEALRKGYGEVAQWPDDGDGLMDALIAARDMMLANWLLASRNPEEAAAVPGYLERLERRIRVYLRVSGT